MERVLFVCIHNSARSQMAEALLRRLGGGRYEAESAGLEPGVLNPLVVEVLQEIGIDISAKKTQSVESCINSDIKYDYVITVCDGASAERCPVFPGGGKRLHWGFDDPSGFTGTHEERLAKTRQVRDDIQRTIEKWLQ
ncbi:arsenate reductase ArsC [Candidatus Magnetominusculus xianensis]|uniref:Arsenate reductase n=1 Tax=Candidatus Magnetominusculus xianensis TaxID=1748249 RepID=A0ABR5SGC2_9BACT|nr:arsenate reductase ArsC [Candidatus Magnetominusculus xianensis]KWT88548.1 arsenate reductase [Candidatus Magnetominusculus xianensis]MBF0404092.1 arsenate reductase ArsC [Nitrospirota bacterium]